MTAKRIDRLLLALGSVLILISSYQLFFSGNQTDAGPKLGTLTSALSIVKTKSAVALDWRDASQGIDVTENQLIYTDNASSAEVVFNEGNSLEIGENSLVKLRSNGDEQGMDVSKGFIRAKLEGDKPLKVQMNGEDYLLSGKDADIQINIQDAKGEIGVISGEVKLEAENGVTENLTTENALAIDGDKITKKKISFKTLSPEKSSVQYISGTSAPVTFTWDPVEKVSVLVSKKPDISKAQTFELESGQSIELATGLWYFRLEGATGASLISSFRIVQEVPLKILRPRHGDSVSLMEEKIQLQWKGEPQDKFLLEWNDGEIHSMPVEHSSATVNVKPGQPFSWRVKIANENRPLAVWSDWQDVQISVVPLPAAPTDLSPHEVEYQIYGKPDEIVDLLWKGEGKFEVEIKDPQNDTQVVKTGHTYINYDATKAGRYAWRVRATDDYLRSSEWSEWKTFTVEDLSGSGEEGGARRIQLKKPDQAITFEWKAATESSSIFELSKDPQFKTIVKKIEINSNGVKVNVPEVGTYYWRSRQYLPNGTFHVSEPERVIIEPTPAPEKPDKLPDFEIEMQSNPVKTSFLDFFISSAYADLPKGTVKITLPVKDEEKAYIVRIYRDAGLKELVFEEQLQTKDFVWLNATPGEYYWQYAIVDYWDRTSLFSDPSKLVVKDDASEPVKPKLLSPIRAVEIDNKDLVVKFTEDKANDKYVVEISPDENFKKIVSKKSSKENSISFSDLTLEPKLYYWRVHAQNKRGEEILSNTGRFTILPPLEKTVIVDTPAAFVKEWKSRGFIGWAPSSDSYKFTDVESGSIDGTAMMSFFIQGTMFREKYVFNGEIVRQAGEVFEGEKYLYQRALVDGIYLFGINPNHKWGAGLAVGQTSGMAYTIKDDVVKSESVSSPSYGVALKNYYSLNQNWDLQGKLYYLLGDIKTMEFGVDAIRGYKSYLLLGGFTYSSREYEVSEGKQTSMRISIGIGKEF